jgi:RNA polymerase sigma-70 factor (ECF subfamily)
VHGERFSAGEAEELGACFAAHARWLFGYACVLVHGDRALADDLVQAAFEAAGRAWCTVGLLSQEQRRAWLRTTVTNIAVSSFRRDAAFRDRLPQIEARYRSAQADTAGEAFSSMALKRCWEIIGGLPARQHAVALLRWHQGMKESEIAAVLGIADKTVATHLRRARRRLIAGLRSEYPGAGQDSEGGSA